VGYRLIALVDKARNGELLGRIKGVRKKFAQDVGFLPPAVHIRDNLVDLKPGMYRVTLRGAVVGEGEAYPGMLMAINPGGATQQLPGTRTTDPAFGLPAVWIEERHRENAQMAGFTVVDCATVVATHLSHLMQVNAARLLGRTETQALVDHVKKLAPNLIEDVIPKLVSVTTLVHPSADFTVRVLVALPLCLKDRPIKRLADEDVDVANTLFPIPISKELAIGIFVLMFCLILNET
jgi:flagellar biosynthesis protein FlhA